MTRVAANKKYVKVNDIVAYSDHSFAYLGNSTVNKNALKEKKFRCKFCYNTFNSLENFTRHLKKHENPIRCSFCNFVAYAQSTLTRHLTKHGIGKKSYKCRYCNEVFLYPATRITHENKHLGRMFPCQICNQQFSSVSKLNTHEQNHPELNKFLCKKCGKYFPHNYMLKQHVRTKHIKDSSSDNLLPIFFCKYCGKGFRNVEWYKIHEEKHKEKSNTTIFSWKLHFQQDCTLCGKFVENVIKLRDHILTVHKDLLGQEDISNLEVCNFCGKDMKRLHFKNEKFLHMIKHLDIVPFRCNNCNFRTSWIKSMKRHLGMSHLQKALYSCDECNQIFEKKHSYLEHLKEKHNIFALQEYLCDKCGETICGKHKIKTHKIKCCKYLKITDETKMPHPCMICQRRFSSHKLLNGHINEVHKDLFTCEECGVEYENITIKNQHKKLFSIDRVCALCDYKAEHGTFLSNHLSKSHPEETYQCDICDHVFASSNCYYKHLKSHRNEEEDSVSHLYLPTYDSEEEELFQVKKKKQNNNTSSTELFVFECSICGDRHPTAITSLQHELMHKEQLHLPNQPSAKDFQGYLSLKNEVSKDSKILDISVIHESKIDSRCFENLWNDINLKQPLVPSKYAPFLSQLVIQEEDLDDLPGLDINTKIPQSLLTSQNRSTYTFNKKFCAKRQKTTTQAVKVPSATSINDSYSCKNIKNCSTDSYPFCEEKSCSNLNEIEGEYLLKIKNLCDSTPIKIVKISKLKVENINLSRSVAKEITIPQIKQSHLLKESFIVNNSFGYQRIINETFTYVNGKKRLVSEDIADVS